MSFLVGYAAWGLTNPAVFSGSENLREFFRQVTRKGHAVTFYHSPEDPVSDAVAQLLPALQQGWAAATEEVRFVGRTVGPTATNADLQPRLAELNAWNILDVSMLSEHIQFDPLTAEQATRMSEPEVLAAARRILLHAESHTPGSPGLDYVAAAAAVSRAAHSEDPKAELAKLLAESSASPLTTAAIATRIAANRKSLESAGQWLPGTLQYAGQCYGGLDRMKVLEERLWSLVNHNPKAVPPSSGLRLRDSVRGEPAAEESAAAAEAEDNDAAVAAAPSGVPVELWLSIRSPYSYLVMERLLALGCEMRSGPEGGFFMPDGTRVVLRPILPNLMRGVPIPSTKKMFILYDAARVAHRHGIPYGFIRDPVGEASKNVLAIASYLQRNVKDGSEWRFLHEAMKSAFSRNEPLLTEQQCKVVGERCGVLPEHITAALGDKAWEAHVAESEQLLKGAGHWGVPAFKHGDKFTWGQDRAWLVLRWLGIDAKPEN